MEKLPDALVVEILSRLDDSADVARCRVAWKTFNTVSPDLRSINLQWPLRKYTESRSRVSSSSQLTSPLKTIFLNLISNLRVLESVHIGAENLIPTGRNAHLVDKGDDMYLTHGGFIKEWLPRVSGVLKSLSISDFFPQSKWRRSKVLSLVSVYCHNLVELKVKHTWLFVVNLKPMPMLTSLTLKDIRLNDNVLRQVNKCFPNLQVLNLISVSGFKQPKIHLLNLKTCHWSEGGYPSYVTVIAPNLITLEFKLEHRLVMLSSSLYIEAPKLSQFRLLIDRIEGEFTIKIFENLKTLSLGSTTIRSLLIKFPFTETVENLSLDRYSGIHEFGDLKFSLKDLFCVFPNVTSLCFNSSAWSDFKLWYGTWDGMKGLKTFRGYLRMVDLLLTPCLACVLDQCINLVDVSLLFHRCDVSRGFIARCMARWPKVKWRWGMWEEGMEDCWITDDQLPKKCSRRKNQITY